MKKYQICTNVSVYDMEELTPEERELVESAKKATATSYSPYSHFQVGAALRIATGEIILGSNQENAAYPAGCCAERTALFWASANYPQDAIKAIAIAAWTNGDFTEEATAPCGICRQALLEYENLHGAPIRVYLYGRKGVQVIPSVAELLPLSFYADSMK